jgi:hypothetical protein
LSFPVPDHVSMSFCLSVLHVQPASRQLTPPPSPPSSSSSFSPPQARPSRRTDFLHPGSHTRDWPAAGKTFAIGIGRGYLSTLTGHPCGDLYKLSMRRSRPPARSMDFPAWTLALGPCQPRMHPIRYAHPAIPLPPHNAAAPSEFPLYFLFPFFLSG